MPRRYLANHASLGYATTAHAALGRTTDTAHVLVDGLADRQALYVAPSRGRNANYAYCMTQNTRLADVAAGSRRAPEVDRAARLSSERVGLQPPASDADTQFPELDPVAVLAGIMARDGSDLSATETLEREIARADHLGVLGGIWDHVTRRLQDARFADALRAALPAGLGGQALDDPACAWLWRTLREAETAGLDASTVLREAAGARSLTGTGSAPGRSAPSRSSARPGSWRPPRDRAGSGCCAGTRRAVPTATTARRRWPGPWPGAGRGAGGRAAAGPSAWAAAVRERTPI